MLATMWRNTGSKTSSEMRSGCTSRLGIIASVKYIDSARIHERIPNFATRVDRIG